MNDNSIKALISGLEQYAAELETAFEKHDDIEQLFDAQFCLDKLQAAFGKYVAFFGENHIKTVSDYEHLIDEADPDVLEQLGKAEHNLELALIKYDEALLQAYHSRISKDFDSVEVWNTDANAYTSFGSYLRESDSKYTLIIMMRYSGCIYCNLHVVAVQDKLDQFKKRVCNVVIVTKGDKSSGTKWKGRMGVELPLLLDDRMQFVHKFGFKRSSHALLKPTSQKEIAEMILTLSPDELSLHGPNYGDTLADAFQLGGNLLIENSSLKVLHDYRSQVARDRPTVKYLTDLIDNLQLRTELEDPNKIVSDPASSASSEHRSKSSSICVVL